MEETLEFLTTLRDRGYVTGRLRALFHLLVGYRIRKGDGVVVSAGQTWRQLADLLFQLKWDREQVRELGLDPAALPPKDRQRFWYLAVIQSKLDSQEAKTEAIDLAQAILASGYTVDGVTTPSV
jgi:hypothetical protein